MSTGTKFVFRQYIGQDQKVKQQEYIANRYVERDLCSRGNEAFCSELLAWNSDVCRVTYGDTS